MPWQWYPSITEKEPANSWINTNMEKESEDKDEIIITFDSFDARKIEIYYEITPKNKNMMAMKFDLLVSRAKRYFWRDIALVIRNVPTLPYVSMSKPIYIIVSN